MNAPVEYESIVKLGAIMGSGGLIVMDEDKCMVDMARFFMDFCVDESCGKCVPCRVGTRQMLRILERICEGNGRLEDIDQLITWASDIQNTALCGLGQTAPNPVLSTLRYFRDEYEAHIEQNRCLAVACGEMFDAPCRHACPAGMDIPAYVSLVRANRLDDAYRVLLRTNPFPSVCGRVCDYVCESKCRRAILDGAVNIKYLKRFITDNANRPMPQPAPVERMEKIAIVGAGPSGLTAARELALRGYQVTVFEELPEAGGMLRYGIPPYRLPHDVLRAEIQAIVDLGVDLRCNTRIGVGVSWERLTIDYDAVYLAVGAHRSTLLGIEGENLEGVVGAVEFLRNFNLNHDQFVGRRVVVVGGGNSAMDAARTAKRLGSEKVTILYRRLRQDMPAQKEEILAAEEEGIQLMFMAAPIRIIGDNGKVEEVVCQRMKFGEFDPSGRKRPLPVPGAEFRLSANQVIPAIGQIPDLGFLTSDPRKAVRISNRGLIQVTDESKARASRKSLIFAGGDAVTGPGVIICGEALIFAGGDAVSGPGTAIWAIADGRKAAEEMDAAIREANGEGPWCPPEEKIDIPREMDEEVVNTAPRGDALLSRRGKGV